MVAEIRRDEELYRQVREFVEEVLMCAKAEAEKQQREKESESKTEVPPQQIDPGTMKRRLGRAKGFMVRMFEALCNCAQSGAAAAARAAPSRAKP